MSEGAERSNVTTGRFKRHARTLIRRRQPLAVWRGGLPSRKGAPYHEVVRTLASLSMLDEPYWSAAAAGDPASAVRLAIQDLMLAQRLTNRNRVDMVMTALWRVAVEGDPAAKMIFRTLIERSFVDPGK